MSKLRLVLFNINFTDPYHLYVFCILLVIDDAYVYLVLYHIVNYYYNSCLPLNSNGLDLYLTLSILSNLNQDDGTARKLINQYNKQEMLTRVQQALVRAWQPLIDRQIDSQIAHHHLSITDDDVDNCCYSVSLRC